MKTFRSWLVMLLAVATTVGFSCAEIPEGDAPNAVCVSGRYWPRGDTGDAEMHPGRACISCHTTLHRGPVFTVAGTVYTALREPNECVGYSASPVTEVEVTDATMRPFVITANRSGNFFTTQQLRFPLRRARVRLADGRVRAMESPPPHGDCNLCHTSRGDEGAPGRILAPGT